MKTCKQRTFFSGLSSGVWIGLTAAVFCLGGCQNPAAQTPVSESQREIAIRSVRISGLTDFAVSPQEPEKNKIKTFVELLNAAESPVKKPGVFRFEFYEYNPLSANPRGKRLMIWPDIDLTDPGINNQYWKDYLRSYEFFLPLAFSPQPDQVYLLEVTCMVGTERLGGLLKIQYQP